MVPNSAKAIPTEPMMRYFQAASRPALSRWMLTSRAETIVVPSTAIHMAPMLFRTGTANMVARNASTSA
jgi:hypothetical protein